MKKARPFEEGPRRLVILSFAVADLRKRPRAASGSEMEPGIEIEAKVTERLVLHLSSGGQRQKRYDDFGDLAHRASFQARRQVGIPDFRVRVTTT